MWLITEDLSCGGKWETGKTFTAGLAAPAAAESLPFLVTPAHVAHTVPSLSVFSSFHVDLMLWTKQEATENLAELQGIIPPLKNPVV